MWSRAVALCTVVALVLSACGDDDTETAAPTTEATTTTSIAPDPDIEGAEVITGLGRDHVSNPTYDDLPPAGGDHIEVWANCAFYGVAVDLGNVVHSLEHGAIWLAYGPDVSDDDTLALSEIQASNPTRLIASVVPELGGEMWAVAWGHRLQLDGPDDPRLDDFVEAYLDQTAPENGAPCHGGIGA